MGKEDKILEKMRASPQNVRYEELVYICAKLFRAPRQAGTSHTTFKMPWQGDPRINIQNKNGKAKPYQVKQALQAIEKFQEGTHD